MSKPKFNIKYKFPEDYNPAYTNGVWGGIAPQGEIVVNFFFERQPLPYEESIELDANNKTSESKVIAPENHELSIMRYVSTGVVMDFETAKSFHEWLGRKIEILETEFGRGE
ncbi:hypothetical protein [Aquibacillus salsiterrae]|uniref:Uncharacterized protein n=1 Tax=Aquibacillus salsiterrae TaxID=2950439 RepID=A0A9X4AG63_9BACI|nr:hypothetical protein [Aquibacillus salsiterrae]MDC3418732.1 hypothetical protein [Aquibacillus salsiterrae]